ncbi:RNA recognition motif domain-containing protein [Agaribacter marinus]|uniref:RNA-binding protein n=1 Tax=Agaribacter marinus TaxID=1431249 RepID=A0AA37T3K5_9ALTE|nr:RNA-binding protein [Agaribacter marinus]GLR72504.1 RNA-binding protein [Agaribacter marinus]
MNKTKQTIILSVVISIISFLVVFIYTNNLLVSLSTPVSITFLLLMTNNSQLTKTNEQKSAQDTKDKSSTTLYIGNLPYKANEDTIRSYFESVSQVLSIRLMKDKRTGRKKGFGFIEVEQGEAKSVIKKLNDSVFMERNLIVRPAKDKVA